MAGGDPTKWDYFGKMNVVPFLQMVLYYKDKNDDIRKQAELKRNGLLR